MPKVEDFLNPTSMLTPGVAGGLTVSISLPFAIAFGVSVKWVALIVSVLLALLIVLSVKALIPRLQRSIYCILNSLIIFSTALGAGINLDPPPQPPAPLEILQPPLSGSLAPGLLGISTAFAQEPNKPSPPKKAETDRGSASSGSKPDQKALSEEQIKKKKYLQQQQQYQQQQKAYSNRWSW